MDLQERAKQRLLRLWLCFLAACAWSLTVMRGLTIRAWPGYSWGLSDVGLGDALTSLIDFLSSNFRLSVSKFRSFNSPSRLIKRTYN